MSTWRIKARAVILQALEDGESAGLDGKALERFVSAAYPWGERANHPYQVWLNEFALLVKDVKRPMSKSKAKTAEPKVLPGQGSLFGGES